MKDDTIRSQVLQYLKDNPDKEVSIYDFVNILKHPFPDRKFSYIGIYTVIKTLKLENVIEFKEDKSRLRTRLLVTLK